MSVGLIPNLFSNNNKHGYIVSTSHKNSFAFKPFNAIAGFDWDTSPLVKSESVPINIWLQIKLLEPTKIYKIAIKGKHFSTSLEKIQSWQLLGSMDGESFDVLIEARDGENTIDDTTKYFYIEPIRTQRFAEQGGRLIPAKASHPAYNYYRVRIGDFQCIAPGLNYFQLFSLDTVLTDYVE